MNEEEVNRRLGISLHNYQNLLKGIADIGTASAIGVTTSILQRFLNCEGYTPHYIIASKMGILSVDLDSILTEIGKKGARGLIIGILIMQKINK